MTRQICVAAVTALAALLWQPAQALACSCAPPPDITTQWGAMPDAVVAARVTSEFTIGAKKIYVAKVRQAFKGCAVKGDRLYIVTRTSSAACGATLAVGATYLLGDDVQPLSSGRWLMNLSACDLQVKWGQLSKAERVFLNGRQVCCDGSCGCADGSPPVQCFVDPCEVATCDQGACQANYCGGCNAEFYDKAGNGVCLPCASNADCGGAEICVDGQCQAGCAADSDCPADQWCRQTMDGPKECVPFQQEGEWCGGFTPIWAQNKCAPGLICTDFPPFVADAPGICRKECKDNKDCDEGQYCAVDGVCRDDGACWIDADCDAEGNSWPHILCLGYSYCGSEGLCGWQCGAEPVPTCEDLAGVDFGMCLAVLGIGVVDGQCTWISGCDAGGITLFDTVEDCETECASPCEDLGGVDFGPCDMLLGVGLVNGACTYVSGCSAQGYEFFTSVEECESACGGGVCLIDGVWYQAGEPYPAGDGCNTCTCMPGGQSICTLMACPLKCEYDGQWYEPGTSFPATDGCNTCMCSPDGAVACTEMACVGGCEVDGKWFAVGDTFPAGDGCNTCTCGDNGMAACTKKGCLIGCTNEMSCSDGFSMCWAPGQQLPCGACFMPEFECAGDNDCGSGMICEPDTSGCLCSPANTCQPGCQSAADCEVGESCGSDGHCAATACAASSDCPLNFDCMNGGCHRRSCSASQECYGFCVNSQCYTESGWCSPPPP